MVHYDLGSELVLVHDGGLLVECYGLTLDGLQAVCVLSCHLFRASDVIFLSEFNIPDVFVKPQGSEIVIHWLKGKQIRCTEIHFHVNLVLLRIILQYFLTRLDDQHDMLLVLAEERSHKQLALDD